MVRNRYRPDVETLESRYLQAAHLTATLTAGVLNVQGTAGADQIILFKDGTDIKVNGVAGKFAAADVKSIVVHGKGGNDLIDLRRLNLVQPTDATPAVVTRIFAGAGNDVVYGTDLADLIFGQQGNDRLFGKGGNDKLHGGRDNDLIGGGAGDDQIWGESGNDHLRGGLGDDTLQGNAGTDLLVGAAGEDMLVGGKGDDCLDGGLGSDKLFGNAGDDRLEGGAKQTLTSGRLVFTADGNVDQLNGGTGTDVVGPIYSPFRKSRLVTESVMDVADKLNSIDDDLRSASAIVE